MSRDGDDFAASDDRNFLRLAVHYGGTLTPAEAARGLGCGRQAAGVTAARLEAGGWLAVAKTARTRSYTVTAAGLAHLEANKTSFLLVEVMDELAADTAAALEHFESVVSVFDHGPGCCCKNCPWNGDHG